MQALRVERACALVYRMTLRNKRFGMDFGNGFVWRTTWGVDELARNDQVNWDTRIGWFGFDRGDQAGRTVQGADWCELAVVGDVRGCVGVPGCAGVCVIGHLYTG
jgi:hypothetical protein